ncbi:MAG: SRPBCC domain-containing protein [Bdellovibrionales bacterium]|nr:SRPBCC domain-containing protein [Bdellovibrionales bacterium]
MAKKNNPSEITLTRVFDAPVNLVWDAWTELEQVAQWWGPRGFTITTHSKDLRPNGSWKYTMHGPDGTDYPNITTYYEVEKHSRLVYDHGATENTPPLFRVTVTFTENKNKTTMEMTMACASAEAAIEIKKHIKNANGNSTWDRLGEYVEKQVSGKDKFFINRSFNINFDEMFTLWTDPEHLSQWLPPTGFQMKFIRADIKPNGHSFYCMFDDKGTKMYGKTHYLEIEKPHHILYTQQFCDENEKVSRHPMAPTWPETMLTKITLTSESETQTRLTVEWEAYGQVTAEELDVFIKSKAGMTVGWTGSFDKLEDYINR